MRNVRDCRTGRGGTAPTRPLVKPCSLNYPSGAASRSSSCKVGVPRGRPWPEDPSLPGSSQAPSRLSSAALQGKPGASGHGKLDGAGIPKRRLLPNWKLRLLRTRRQEPCRQRHAALAKARLQLWPEGASNHGAGACQSRVLRRILPLVQLKRAGGKWDLSSIVTKALQQIYGPTLPCLISVSPIFRGTFRQGTWAAPTEIGVCVLCRPLP